MPAQSEIPTPGQEVIGIYQDVQERLRSGPLQNGNLLFSAEHQGRANALQGFLKSLDRDALGRILDEGFDATTPPSLEIEKLLGPAHLTAMKINSLVLPRYIELQNQAIEQLLTGRLRVSRLEGAQPNAIQEPTPGDNEEVEGPVTGKIRQSPWVQLGIFRVHPPKLPRHHSAKAFYIRPLNRAGESQIDIERIAG